MAPTHRPAGRPRRGASRTTPERSVEENAQALDEALDARAHGRRRARRARRRAGPLQRRRRGRLRRRRAWSPGAHPDETLRAVSQALARETARRSARADQRARRRGRAAADSATSRALLDGGARARAAPGRPAGLLVAARRRVARDALRPPRTLIMRAQCPRRRSPRSDPTGVDGARADARRRTAARVCRRASR